MSDPISLARLLEKMGQLPPITVVFTPPGITMIAGGAHANPKLVINSRGDWEFSGHAWEGDLTSDDYTMVAVLVAGRDDKNQVPVFSQSGTLHGHLALGDDEQDWQQQNNLPSLSDNWDAVRFSEVSWTLNASDNAWEIMEVAMNAAFIGAGAVVVGAVVLAVSSGSGHGEWNTDDNGNKYYKYEF